MGLTLSLIFEAQLRCCICLDVFTSPVSTPCGHNFCQACLQGYWDRCDFYRCPLCKAIFNEKPKLSINYSFSEITELFKESRQAICSEVSPFGSLEPHLTDTNFRSHDLVECPEHGLCKNHNRPLEMFYTCDQTRFSEQCGQTELERTKADIQQFIQERLKKLEEIQKSVELSKINSRRDIENSIQAFTTLVDSIVKSQMEFIEKVQEKQKAAVSRAEGFIKELEKEITELQRRNVELEQLWHTEDHMHFLQRLPMLCTSPHTQDWTETTVHTNVAVGTVRCVTSGLKRACRENENFSEAEFQRIQLHAADVTLDPSTANPWLVLSADGKRVWDGDTQLHVPDGPERFDSSVCVLAKEGFTTGRHYWEVEVGEKVAWDIGVVRESINRKGIINANPEDGYWTMCLRHSNTYSCCGTCCFALPLNRRPRKLGVYLDYEEGQISFYNVDSQSHMYTHYHTFTERIYPFFSPYTNDDGLNTAPLFISPVGTAAQ